MWLITDEGFLSVVAFDPAKDTVKRSHRQVKSWGKDPILVRARVKSDLEQLSRFWSKLRIEEDTTADYSWRAVMPRKRWADYLATKGSEIDYDSHFKEVVKKRSKHKDLGARMYSVMVSMWSEMSTLQDNPPYGGKWWSSYGGSGHTGSGSINDLSKGLCTAYIKSTMPGGKVNTKWCNYGSNHKGTHSYEKTADVTPSSTIAGEIVGELFGGSQTGNTQTHVYDSTNPLDYPDAVEDMCLKLLQAAPEDIDVDMATPYATYELWCVALETSPKSKLDAEQIIKILEELSEDVMTTTTARHKYLAALDAYTSGADSHVIPDDVNPIVLESREEFPADAIIGG